MKRMNLLCALLLASVMLSFVTNLFVGADAMASGFMAGWNQAGAEYNNEGMVYSSCELKPKVSDYFFKTVSKPDGGVIAFNPTAIDYHVVAVKDAYGAITNFIAMIIGVFMVGLFLYLWWLFFRLIRDINHGEIFTRDTERGFRYMAVAMLLFYACEWIFAISRYLNEAHILQMKDFEVALSDTPTGYTLICGVFLLIVAQIFTVAREMKEEQELTI